MINIKSYSKSKDSDGSASGGRSTFVTSSIANEAKRLSTTHQIWGHPFNGTQDVEGDLNVPNLTTDERVIVGSDLKVKGDTELVGEATIKGDTSVEGTLDVDKKVTAKQNLQVNQNLSVNGSTQLNATTISGTTDARNIVPNADSQYNLGSELKQWYNIYSANAWFNNLDVTGQAHFKEVIIDRIKSVGGQIILSPANFKVDKVVSEYYSSRSEDQNGVFSWWESNLNSYIHSELETLQSIDYLDGITIVRLGQFKHNKETGKEILQEFVKGDLILHQTFNIGEGVSVDVSNSFYRSVVVDTGIWIDFSETPLGMSSYYHSDYDTNPIDEDAILYYNQYKDQGAEIYIYIDIAMSLDGFLTAPDKTIPIYEAWNKQLCGVVDVSEGDEIVCLGNNSDTSRQNAIILSAYSTGLDNSVTPPSIVQYKGINNFEHLRNFKYNVMASNGNYFRGDFTTDTGQTIQEIINDSTIERKLIPLSNTAKITNDVLRIRLNCYVVAVQGTNVKQINPNSEEWNKDYSLVTPYILNERGTKIGTMSLNTTYNRWYYNLEITEYQSKKTPTMLRVVLDSTKPEMVDTYNVEIGKDESTIKLVPISNKMILSTSNNLVCNFSTYVIKQQGGSVEYIDSGDYDYQDYSFEYCVKVLYGDGTQNSLTYRSNTKQWTFSKNIPDFTTVSQSNPDASTTAFNSARVILYKHIYDDGDGTYIEMDSYDVTVTTDSGAYFAVTDNIRSRVQDAENNISEIIQDADQIELNVYSNLKKTGIDIQNEKITLRADKTEIEGNALNLWGDQSGFIIGDADHTPRLQLKNNEMDTYANFGGGQKWASVDVVSDEGYGTDWEGFSDYVNLGTYNAYTNIALTKATCFVDSGSGGSTSYGAKLWVKQYLYKVSEVDGQLVYTDFWQSDVIYSQCADNGIEPIPDVLSLTVRATETCQYAVRYLVHFYDWTCAEGQRRKLWASIYYLPSNITSKAVMAKDGFGVINDSHNHIYYGKEGFAVKRWFNDITTDQFLKNGIEMNYNRLNLYGNVNIQKKYASFSGSYHELSLHNFDIAIIHTGSVLTLFWYTSGDNVLCGRTVRVYVHSTCKVGASRGSDIGQQGAGSKFVYCADGTVTRLAMQWYDGEYYNDTYNGGQQLTWQAGTCYDITYIDDDWIEITRVG